MVHAVPVRLSSAQVMVRHGTYRICRHGSPYTGRPSTACGTVPLTLANKLIQSV